MSLILSDPNLKSWDDFDAYSRTRLSIGLNVPVRYANGWMHHHVHDITNYVESITAKLSFKVFYDGGELTKPIIFSSDLQQYFVSPFFLESKDVSAFGYFYAQHGTVRPNDLQGLLVRIRNSAVGEYDHSFWGFSPSEASLIQRWVSAEIWADDRLEDAMNIDRRTLRTAHPAYVSLRGAIHEHLRTVLQSARKDIYNHASEDKKRQRSEHSIELMNELVVDIHNVAPRASEALHRVLLSSANNSMFRKNIERSFTVSEVVKILIRISDGIVDAAAVDELLRRFVKEIGE